MARVGLLAATGYTGIELFKLLVKHPSVEILFASSESNPGANLSDLYPSIKGVGDIVLGTLEDSIHRAKEVEIVISCLPRGVAMGTIPQFLEQGCSVIDLSGDFRLHSPETYRVWYGDDHKAPHLLEAIIYGLPEIHREAIRHARLIGAPGCYPTSVILGLAPLLEIGAIDLSDIIIDAKSGISGAGRKLALRTHFVESNETVIPYDIGRVHRHIGEMEQETSKISGQPCRIIFTPQQIPINRGILSSIYVRLTEDLSQKEITDIYKRRYGGEPFIRIAESYLPEPRFVANTNFCDIALHRPIGTNRLLILSTVDNLIKGAVGQIVQCLNLMIGVGETTGLL
jgi:N-acetyl-gamma-glutamyl-phosphate reductase